MNLSDKCNHGLAFFVLTGLLDQALPKLSFWLGKALPLVAYGLFIEVVQGQLGYREMSWLDVMADSAGIIVFFAARYPLQKLLDRVVSFSSPHPPNA